MYPVRLLLITEYLWPITRKLFLYTSSFGYESERKAFSYDAPLILCSSQQKGQTFSNGCWWKVNERRLIVGYIEGSHLEAFRTRSLQIPAMRLTRSEYTIVSSCRHSTVLLYISRTKRKQAPLCHCSRQSRWLSYTDMHCTSTLGSIISRSCCAWDDLAWMLVHHWLREI